MKLGFLKNSLFWIAILVFGYAVVLAVRPSEAWFGVPGEWTWSGRPPSPSTYTRWAPAIAVLILTVCLIIVADRRWEKMKNGTRIGALIGLVILIPVIQISLKYIHYRFPLESYLHRTIGPLNGFWQAAISIESLPAYLRNYTDSMIAVRGDYIHLATHPPGNVIWLWLWRQAFNLMPGIAHSIAHAFRAYACADLQFVTLSDARIATAFGQMSVVFLSGLGVIPVYMWAKQLTHSRGAWRAAALFTVLPTLSLFTMRWDTLYPILTASAFAAIHRGLVTRKKHWWFISGTIVSLASFCSFGNAILAPGVALYALLFLGLQDRSFARVFQPWKHWLALIIGGYSIWGIFQLVSGISVWQMLKVTGGIQSELRAAYNYPLWLFYNLVDIFTMTGFPISIPFLIQGTRSIQQLTSRRKITPSFGIVPALTVLLVIILVDISGLSPGETARLWLHLSTGMIVAVVLWLEQRPQRWIFGVLVALLAFQCLWLTLFLRVSETGLPSYVKRTTATSPNPPSALAEFEDGIVLAEIAVAPETVQPASFIEVTLDWYAGQRTDIPYTVFVHLVDETGQPVAQSDAMPVENSLPTTCWLAGETIQDVHVLQIPAGTEPGDYRLLIGLYDLRTMSRLSLIDASPSTDVYTHDTHVTIKTE